MRKTETIGALRSRLCSFIALHAKYLARFKLYATNNDERITAIATERDGFTDLVVTAYTLLVRVTTTPNSRYPPSPFTVQLLPG